MKSKRRSTSSGYRRELGITDLAPLEAASREDRLRSVKGLGVAVQRKILEGLPAPAPPPPELDQTGLVRMQGQRKPRQPIPQFCLKPLGIGLVFKAGDDVIGIAHQDDVPSGMVANPPDEGRPANCARLTSSR